MTGTTQQTATTVLLVEDTLSLARTYEEYLRSDQIQVIHADTGRKALDAIELHCPDAILLDLMLPDMDGLDILRLVDDQTLGTAVVVITAYGSVNTAVEAMRLGAFDFLIKPFSAERLRATLQAAVEHHRHASMAASYRRGFERSGFCGFTGSSLPMQAVYRVIESAAGSKATVFITGESGTGKEVCAQAIHDSSPRADRPFIALNCAAIPRDLMESEIFGHVKGAFTGAIQEREGAARLANGGTLFLDEICEMDMSLQTKLLRFVQTGSFQKVGGSRLENVDIRFICATNRDPLIEMEAGRFREDLYYRLHVIPIQLPPLRERGDDVIEIARGFLADYSREEKRRFRDFSPEVEAALRTYSWPGNVRQLQNVMRNVVVLNDGELVATDMLAPPLNTLAPAAPPADAAPWVPPRETDDGEIRPLADVEREVIERAISLCDGNVPKAAALLEISASTIYRKRAAWDEADRKTSTLRMSAIPPSA